MSITHKSYVLWALAVGVAVAFALPTLALAANTPSFYNSLFDGQEEAWVNPGDDLDIEIFVEVAEGEVLHAITTDIVGDGKARQCHDVSNVQGERERTYNITHENAPPNTGDYGLVIDGYTADNMSEANGHRGDTACTGDNDELYNESDVVHVIPDGDDSDSDSDDDEDLGGGIFGFGSFDELVKALKAALGLDKPAKPAYCASIGVSLYGQSGPQVVGVQNTLIANGFPIGYGATGYWGAQTQSAWSAAAANCN